MRGFNPLGRFSPEFETASIKYGMSQDLQIPAGQLVDWYCFDEANTVVDEIYDVGADTGGRAWLAPFKVPVVNALITQGETYQNERGLYTIDNLVMVINFREAERLLPTLITDSDSHLRDRVGYRGEVFELTRVFPKGQVRLNYVVLRVDAMQVKPEELVNDQPMMGIG